MSTINVTVEQVASIEAHPNADKLEVAKILGTQTVVPKGQYKTGDRVVFFPPDILIPQDVSQWLRVGDYLKRSEIEGIECKCRVAACRLRGVPSYGFISPVPQLLRAHPVGSDVTITYMAQKYEPPQKHLDGDIAPPHPAFHRYTEIEHYWKYPDVIKPGTPVRISEKVHGTNSRVGLIDGQLMGGSNKTNRKQFDAQGRLSLYWEPLENEDILNLLSSLDGNVIIFGEIYGPSIQDLDYGGAGYRVFDISVNGLYLDYADLRALTQDINTMPLLYEGPFDPARVEEFTCGPTLIGEPKCKFKGREGCVITPLVEQQGICLGRVILKSVSADYLNRRRAKDL